jgi:hypothetical protein
MSTPALSIDAVGAVCRPTAIRKWSTKKPTTMMRSMIQSHRGTPTSSLELAWLA